MRTRLTAAFGMLAILVGCSAPQGGGGAAAATGTPADEQAVRALAEKYAAANTAKDTVALAAIMTDDYQDVEPTGRVQNRAAAIAAAAQEWAMVPAGVSMKMTAGTSFVRWIDATHAVAGGTWEMSPAAPGMPARGSWLGIAAKQGNDWKMISALGSPDMTPMMPAPPAAPPAKKP